MKRFFASVLAAALLCTMIFCGSVSAETLTELIPSDGYGRLYPYIDEHDWDIRYGFCDAEGTKVTDPVYTLIMRVPLGDSFFFVLEQQDDEGGYQSKFASADGSIVSECWYSEVASLGTNRVRVIHSGEDCAFEILDEQLQICATELDFRMNDQQLIPVDYSEGRWLCMSEDSYVLVDDNMVPLCQASGDITFDRFGDVIITDSLGWVSVLDAENHPVIADGRSVFSQFSRINENMALVVFPDGESHIVDAKGNDIWEDVKQVYIGWLGGYMLCSEYGAEDCTYRYLSRSGELLIEGTGADYAEWEDMGFGKYFSKRTDNTTVIRNFADGTETTLPFASYHTVLWGTDTDTQAVCSVYIPEGHTHDVYLAMPDGKIYQQESCLLNWVTDAITGESYFVTFDGNDESLGTVHSADMSAELFSFNGWYDVGDGIISISNGETCTLYRPDGSVLFEHSSGTRG